MSRAADITWRNHLNRRIRAMEKELADLMPQVPDAALVTRERLAVHEIRSAMRAASRSLDTRGTDMMS